MQKKLGVVVTGVIVITLVFSIGMSGPRAANAASPNTAQNVAVINPTAAPIPTSNVPVPFKTILIYDQQNATFASYTVPPKQRIIIHQVNVGALVPIGKTPLVSLWVPPTDPNNTGFLGAFQAVPIFTKVSNFQGVQDRFVANMGSDLILDAGQQFTWYISNAAGENPFGANLVASISLSGEVIDLP